MTSYIFRHTPLEVVNTIASSQIVVWNVCKNEVHLTNKLAMEHNLWITVSELKVLQFNTLSVHDKC